MKRDLLTIDEAIKILEENWRGKKTYSKGTIYNKICDGTLTNFNPKQKPVLLDKMEVIAHMGLKIA